VVSDVFPGGPAAAAGLLPGDTIVAIDGAPPGRSLLLPMLYHAAGTRLELDLDRAGVRSTVTLELAVQAYPVVSARIVNHAGVIRVHAVVTSSDPNRDAAALARAAIAALDVRNVRGLVLDLRGCPGGEGVAALASVLTTIDPILLFRDVAGAETAWPRAGERVAWPHFIDVLVDDQTGSAGEMVAFAIHEQGGIRVIGQPTIGEMTMPGVLDLGDGHVLVYPAQRAIGSISHERPRGGRMQPDQLVASPTAADVLAGKDAQLDAAIKWATRRKP
jgi:carboxyl-terminal processing protease